MPNEYINKVSACNEIKRFAGYLDDDMIYRLQIALSRIPAADVEPVRHGYWVYKMRERTKYEKVTGFDELGFIHTVTVQTHVKGPVPYCGLCDALAADSFMDHCPRCGAKMDTEPPKEEDNDKPRKSKAESQQKNGD